MRLEQEFEVEREGSFTDVLLRVLDACGSTRGTRTEIAEEHGLSCGETWTSMEVRGD
jgi:hypothetical protein